MQRCNICGEEQEENAKFCQKCGNKLEVTTTKNTSIQSVASKEIDKETTKETEPKTYLKNQQKVHAQTNQNQNVFNPMLEYKEGKSGAYYLNLPSALRIAVLGEIIIGFLDIAGSLIMLTLYLALTQVLKTQINLPGVDFVRTSFTVIVVVTIIISGLRFYNKKSKLRYNIYLTTIGGYLLMKLVFTIIDQNIFELINFLIAFSLFNLIVVITADTRDWFEMRKKLDVGSVKGQTRY